MRTYLYGASDDLIEIDGAITAPHTLLGDSFASDLR